MWSKPTFALATSLALAACTTHAEDPGRALTDADLVAYNARPFDKAAMMGHQLTLGVHHGTPVIVDFPCGDVCPQYTIRIIHYAVGPGPACQAIGGVTVTQDVPRSIATVPTDFCEPKALTVPR